MKEIKLNNGYITLVDDEDYEYLSQYKWYAHNKKGDNTCYVRRTNPGYKKKTVVMHRVIMKDPYNRQIDHIDHNGLNNQKVNLRIVTSSQNQMNRLPRGKSKYVGVCFNKSVKKWQASIHLNKKYIYLGVYKEETEAAKAFNHAAMEYYGEYANLNRI